VPRNEQIFIVLFSILLLLNVLIIFTPTYFLHVVKAETGGPTQGEGTYENLTGNWTINATDTVYCGNRTLNLTGNLTIYGKLTLQNVTLRFNSTYGAPQHGIYVESGGTLVIRDNDGDWNTTEDGCNITVINNKTRFLFQVKAGSNFTMENSRLSYCGSTSNVIERSGIYINTHSCSIKNNFFAHGSCGVALHNAKNCFLMGNHFNYNVYGLWLNNAESNMIHNNQISSNSLIGIKSMYSIGNHFENNECNNNQMYYGFMLYSSHNNSLLNNTCNSNEKVGFHIEKSENNTLMNNTIKYNPRGIHLTESLNTSVYNNSMIENGIHISGGLLKYHNSHNIDSSNTINGKSLYYWKNVDGGVVPLNAGGVILVNCTNVTIENQNVSRSGMGISVQCSSMNRIFNNTACCNYGHGISLWNANYNVIENNTANFNRYSGIFLDDVFIGEGAKELNMNCTNNIIRRNTCNSNNNSGILLDCSYHPIDMCELIENNCSNNGGNGIYVKFSRNSADEMNFFNNTCSNNKYYGMKIYSGLSGSFNYGIISNNTCKSNGVGMKLSVKGSNLKGNVIEKNMCSFNGGNSIILTIYNSTISNNMCNNGSGSGITIEGDGNLLSNNTCCFKEDNGIEVEEGDSNIFVNNTCDRNGWSGIYGEGDKNVFRKNRCNFNVNSGICISGNGNEIHNNTFRNNTVGIYLVECENQVINNNDLDGNGLIIKGYRVPYWDSHTIVGNTVNGKPLVYWKNRNGGKVSQGAGQIILGDCTNVIIENQRFENSSAGIMMGFSDENCIRNNTCYSNDMYGIYIRDSDKNFLYNNSCYNNGMTGLYLEDECDDNTIMYNDCIDNEDSGIAIEGNSNDIRNNTCSYNEVQGIYLGYSENNICINNTCSFNNRNGFAFSRLTHNFFLNNTCCSNNGSAFYIWDSDNNTIENNTCNFNNQTGIITIRNSNDNIIKYNTIVSNNYYGIDMGDETIRNEIHNNIFINNNKGNVQAIDNGNSNNWDNTKNRGNYWSDYGTRYPGAANDRWVWNIPYEIYGMAGAKDRFPLCSPPFENVIPQIESDDTINVTTTGASLTFIGNFTDNYMITSVNVIYTYNHVNYYNISMANTSPKTWETTIAISINKTMLQYYYYAEDAARNRLTTPVNSIRIIDNILPKCLVDNTPDTPTTGDNFSFRANFTDNIEMGSVQVAYSFDLTNYSHIPMVNIDTGMWSTHLLVETNITALSYYFIFDDEEGNMNTTDVRILTVQDNDPPVLLNDGTAIYCTTGDNFSFSINISDNIGMTGAMVDNFFNNISSGNVSMNQVNDHQWEKTIIIDPSATELHYVFYIKDLSGNYYISERKGIEILDNDPPNLINDTTSTNPTTGDIFTFSGIFEDNIEIGSIHVNYTLDTLHNHQLNLSRLSGNEWYVNIRIPLHSRSLNYYFHCHDLSGNVIQSKMVYLIITDNDPPISDAGNDVSTNMTTDMNFDGSKSSDNIAIVNYTWSFKYDNETIQIYGQKPSYLFDLPGVYIVMLTVSDNGGNSATDMVNITILKREGINDDDETGDDEEDDDNDDTENDDAENNDIEDDDTSKQDSESSSTLPIWIIIPLVLVVLIIISLILFFVLRRKRGEEVPSKEEIPQKTNEITDITTKESSVENEESKGEEEKDYEYIVDEGKERGEDNWEVSEWKGEEGKGDTNEEEEEDDWEASEWEEVEDEKGDQDIWDEDEEDEWEVDDGKEVEDEREEDDIWDADIIEIEEEVED